MPRYCTNHPDRETLRICGRCERPFCPDCLVDTPVGGRCRECARPSKSARRPIAWWRWPAIVAVALFGGLIGGPVTGAVPFLGLFLAYLAGQWLATQVLAISGRRTNSVLLAVTVTSIVVGVLIGRAWSIGLMATAGVPLPARLEFLMSPRLYLETLPNIWIWATAALMGFGATTRLR